MNKQIDQMLQQRMDRKNFLKHVALGVVMMTGAASIVKTFYNPEQQQAQGAQKNQGMAYGSSAYGGVKRT